MSADSSKGENVNNRILEFYVYVDDNRAETVIADTWETADGRLRLRKDGKMVAVFSVWQYFMIKERAQLNSEAAEIIYGQEWERERDRVFAALKYGDIRVEVDYNRTPWKEEHPEDCLIWRVYAKEAGHAKG